MDPEKDKRILIIDSNAADRKKYIRMLEKNYIRMFKFIEAGNCKNGLDLCKKFQIDCIILDYNLPDQTGIVFLKKLQHELELKIPAVMISDEGNEEIVVLALGNGAQDYLTKNNLNHENLYVAIENAIDRIHMQEKIAAQQQEIYEKNQRLSEINESLKNFAHVVAHDVKEPLSSIMSALNLIVERNKNITDRERLMMNECIKTSRRMHALISDVLKLSEGAVDDGQREFINLSDIMDLVVADLENAICEKNAFIRLYGMPFVRCNKSNFYQVFLNLTKNALKYSKRDQRPRLDIQGRFLHDIIAEEENNKYHFKVDFRDNGIGFSSMDKDAVFSPFKRLHAEDDVEGSGIGLASVKKILDFYKCKIVADAKPGEGACFSIYLPDDMVEVDWDDAQKTEKIIACITHCESGKRHAFTILERNRDQINGFCHGAVEAEVNDGFEMNQKIYNLTKIKKIDSSSTLLTLSENDAPDS